MANSYLKVCYRSVLSVMVLWAALISACSGEITDKEFLKQFRDLPDYNNPKIELQKTEALLKVVNNYQKYLLLTRAASVSVKADNLEKAESFANTLLTLSKEYTDDWNYGNAVHDGNVVLGVVALRKGDKSMAIKHLNMAGDTPGSPQLNSFGPTMLLAKELLDKGEDEVVINYFERCKEFWKHNDGRLDSWIAAIKGGGAPYFGDNLEH